MKNIKKIGTSFEDKSETTLTGRGLMPWEQKVSDERTGKRRFHGAFTGGFSAGYKNTCGSDLGFTPKSFVSSRSSRSNLKQELSDFMDHEDLEEFSISNNLKKVEQRNLYEEDESDKEYGPTMPPVTEVASKLDYFGLGFKLKPENLSEDPVKLSKKLIGDKYNFTEVEDNEEVLETNASGIRLTGEVPGFVLDISVQENFKYFSPALPANYRPESYLLALKYSHKRREVKEDHSFPEVLSNQDIDKLKKVKVFVKAKDMNETKKVINKEMLPFKDDDVKNNRCYIFFCEMEGLETGGLCENRLMTASQIKKEREEFLNAYQVWKSGQRVRELQENEGKKIVKKIEVKSNVSQVELPVKRNPIDCFQDLSQSDTLDFLVKRVKLN